MWGLDFSNPDSVQYTIDAKGKERLKGHSSRNYKTLSALTEKLQRMLKKNNGSPLLLNELLVTAKKTQIENNQHIAGILINDVMLKNLKLTLKLLCFMEVFLPGRNLYKYHDSRGELEEIKFSELKSHIIELKVKQIQKDIEKCKWGLSKL